MTVLIFVIFAFIMVLWFFTGDHFYPESSDEYSGDDFEVVCEDEDDPQNHANRREIEARNQAILKLENLL